MWYPTCWKHMLNTEIRMVSGIEKEIDLDHGIYAEILDLGAPNSRYAESLMSVAEKVIAGEYEDVLNSDCLDTFCALAVGESSEISIQTRLENLLEVIREQIDCDPLNSRVLSLLLLFCGASALQEFIRCNWTGPSQGKTRTYSLCSKFFSGVADCRTEVMKLLTEDGESVSNNVLQPELLLFAKSLIFSADSAFCVTREWWAVRCLNLHQHILEERSASLHDTMKHLISRNLSNRRIEAVPEMFIQLLLEAGQIHLFYHEITPARNYFQKAREIIGMNIGLSGAVGKRTKFQSKPVAQLYIEVKQTGGFCYQFQYEPTDLPDDVALEDDVLLGEVKFMVDGEVMPHNLGHLEQVLLLAECRLHQRSAASDELLAEELTTYVQCLLSQPNLWSVKTAALLLRCRLERCKSRKVERAMMQLESLLQSARKEAQNAHKRQCMFYSIVFPPYWVIEKELADALVSLGALKSALEVYQRLDLWEDIVKCYQVLEQNEKAAELVRKRMKENETPVLWCILGDVTNDLSCYEKALELSKGKSARAHRSKGYYYYRKRDYKSSILSFRKSLELNRIQLSVWFSLAYSATMVEDYELAAQAYRHVVTLDPENFEAWNNLSNAYIKLKQKERAYRTLQEALKCNYEDWRVWENFILVCVDVGAFDDAIQAYHRLMDIKGKHEDTEVLGIIVKAVTSDLRDFTGQTSSRLKTKALQLFGRITSVITNNAEIWKLYSLLHMAEPEYLNNKETLERVLNYLQKSHKCRLQSVQWVKDETAFRSVMSDALELAGIYLAYLSMVEGGLKLQSQTSAKLMFRNVISRAEKQMQDLSPEFAKEMEEQVELLKQKLSDIESV